MWRRSYVAAEAQTLEGQWTIFISKAEISKPYGDFTTASHLVPGETYFAVHFLDDRLLVPELTALVFIGRDRQPGDSGKLYFQDAGSYLTGVRYESSSHANEAEFHTVDQDTPFVFEFERALETLMLCSLKRRAARDGG